MFEMEETEKAMVYHTYTETMHLCYNFGFEVRLSQLCFFQIDLHKIAGRQSMLAVDLGEVKRATPPVLIKRFFNKPSFEGYCVIGVLSF